MKEKIDQLKNKLGGLKSQAGRMWQDVESDNPAEESKVKFLLVFLNGASLLIFLVSLALYLSMTFREGVTVGYQSWLVDFYFKIVKNLPLISLLSVIATYIFYDKKKVKLAFLSTLAPYFCLLLIVVLLLLVRIFQGSTVFKAIWIF